MRIMSRGPRLLVGKIFSSLFLLPLLVWTTWISGYMAYSFLRRAATYSWQEADCTILTSEVEESADTDGPVYSLKVLYSYTVGGWRHTGETYRSDYAGSSDIGKARGLADRYPEGSHHLCYVNPRRPSSSMLQRSGFWVYLFFPLFALFAAMIGARLYDLWRPRTTLRVERRVHHMLRRLSVRFYVGLLFGFILFIGIVFTSVFVPPLLRAVEARSWPVRWCTVLDSSVRVYRADREESPTYSADVLYTYVADGQPYKSNRYHFLGNSLDDQAEARRVVQSLPPEKRVRCYVNPARPSESVLNRRIDSEYVISVISPLLALAGLTGLFFVARSWWLERRGGHDDPPS